MRIPFGVRPRYYLDEMWRFLVVVGTGLTIMAECVQRTETRNGKLEVIAVSLTGASLKPDEVTVFADSQQVATTRSSKIRLPYGNYRVRVDLRGGSEVRVDRTGDFVIGGLEDSSYLVVVMQDESVVHQQVVKTYPVDSAPELSIELR